MHTAALAASVLCCAPYSLPPRGRFMTSAPKKSAVLYHYPCSDGAFAALAAHLYFSVVSQPVLFFPNTVYDPVRVNDLPLDEVNDVYLLDFIGPSGFVEEISTKVESVTILDHHKTAYEALCGNVSIGKNVTKIIDMDRSGATVAFDFFKEQLSLRTDISKDHGILHPHVETSYKLVSDNKFERVHKLFKYIEDADLWRWELPHSKAFTSGLRDMNIEYNVNLNSALFDQAVNADSISDLRSELGNQLAQKSQNLGLRGIGAVVYTVAELSDQMKISLRSINSEDTTLVSKQYGGGGHQKASSFMLDRGEFEKWKIESDISMSSG